MVNQLDIKDKQGTLKKLSYTRDVSTVRQWEEMVLENQVIFTAFVDIYKVEIDLVLEVASQIERHLFNGSGEGDVLRRKQRQGDIYKDQLSQGGNKEDLAL